MTSKHSVPERGAASYTGPNRGIPSGQRQQEMQSCTLESERTSVWSRHLEDVQSTEHEESARGLIKTGAIHVINDGRQGMPCRHGSPVVCLQFAGASVAAFLRYLETMLRTPCRSILRTDLNPTEGRSDGVKSTELWCNSVSIRRVRYTEWHEALCECLLQGFRHRDMQLLPNTAWPRHDDFAACSRLPVLFSPCFRLYP
ncbi:hypothetical protein M440DRAFT_199442 [Trichoderma longibrachiatum ATCC 18648]|uniref:Uncharacterized protein n=1 Tax=Trichoderma longibrachiatum ATCC 18648 TaxID=983965 RepID=A0A2T4CGE0_TRILO|nr:hypothetical protein M440DRAFT_199442 [Trichoderma longibrachiatum ATCC 18648]